LALAQRCIEHQRLTGTVDGELDGVTGTMRNQGIQIGMTIVDLDVVDLEDDVARFSPARAAGDPAGTSVTRMPVCTRRP